MASASASEILKPMCYKLDILKKNVELLKCIKANKPESLELLMKIDAASKEVIQSFEDIKNSANKQKCLTVKMQDLQAELSSSINKLDRLEELVKAKQVTDNNGSDSKNTSTSASCSSQEHTPYNKSLGRECHRFDINRLNMKEFASIPKYMLGRLSLEDINKFVDVVNAALSKKYSLLSKPVAPLKSPDLSLYRKFEWQNRLLQGDFITEDDLMKELGKQVLGKEDCNFLAILRHTRKLSRKTFGGGVAYVVV